MQPSGTWTAGKLLALVADPGGVEWTHKVGVAGPVDGSAKPTTRLLAVRGWVAKTRTDQGSPSAAEAKAALSAARFPGRNAGVWHPDKIWSIMKIGSSWYPLTVCPELPTLRQIASLNERLAAWTEMIQVSVDVHRLHKIGLDINPANFGREASTSRLYYLDEELYPRLGEHEVAGAIVARIPEEAHADDVVWERWGSNLAIALSLGDSSDEAITSAIENYPLAEIYEASRRALLVGFRRARSVDRRRRSTSTPSNDEITCVLADVHANLPALEAVLAEARAHGASRWLFLGDAIGYGPYPAECVRRLAELPNAILVRGNHDHAISTGRFEMGMNSLARQCAEWTRSALGASELAWLGSLPTDHVETGWLAVHGAPKDPHRFLAYVYELTYEDNLRHMRDKRIPICFYGHTHIQLVHVELAAGISKLAGPRELELSPRHTWLVNPGSVGQPRDGDARAGYALWNQRTGELRVRRVAYDLERTLSAVYAAALPSQVATRLQSGT